MTAVAAKMREPIEVAARVENPRGKANAVAQVLKDLALLLTIWNRNQTRRYTKTGNIKRTNNLKRKRAREIAAVAL